MGRTKGAKDKQPRQPRTGDKPVAQNEIIRIKRDDRPILEALAEQFGLSQSDVVSKLINDASERNSTSNESEQ